MVIDTIFDNFDPFGHFEVKFLDFSSKSVKILNISNFFVSFCVDLCIKILCEKIYSCVSDLENLRIFNIFPIFLIDHSLEIEFYPLTFKFKIRMFWISRMPQNIRIFYILRDFLPETGKNRYLLIISVSFRLCRGLNCVKKKW